jgi:hypothetical protein
MEPFEWDNGTRMYENENPMLRGKFKDAYFDERLCT